MKRNGPLCRGELVEVRAPEEILDTLDDEGTLGHLPFMPEMLPFCGRRFRVAKRVVKTCSFTGSGTNMRGFPSDDVVTLDGPRCSGDAHDGCPKACTIFWRTAWLRRVEDAAERGAAFDGSSQLSARLKTTSGPSKYFCQASELLRATTPISRWDRFAKCFSEVRAGNCTSLEMVQRIAIWVFWKVRRTLWGEHVQGPNQSTPAESLSLQAGDLVEVKPLNDIVKTLNKSGHNRGLLFTPDMRQQCGRRRRVERRLEKIIVDGTGEMKKMSNTVYLEGSLCGCAHVAFGGCPRNEFNYWREIWLQRSR